MPDPITLAVPDNVRTILEHATRMSVPVYPAPDLDGAPVVVVPQGFKLETVPWASTKAREMREVVRFEGIDSFCRYVTVWKDAAGAGASVIFSSTGEKRALVAALDYHRVSVDGSPVPSFHRHVAIYAPKWSQRLVTWSGANRKQMTQWEFAQFLETNLRDISLPAGATLLGIINEWAVEGAVKFSKVQRMQDGTVSCSFSNEVTATARQVPVPTEFQLAIPVFANELPVAVPARLRYRLNQGSGELKFWFELDQLEEAVDFAWAGIMAKAKTGTGIAPLQGIPNSIKIG